MVGPKKWRKAIFTGSKAKKFKGPYVASDIVLKVYR